MTTYEAIFILNSRKAEDGGEAFCRDVAKHIKALGGTVHERLSMGRKQLAHAIGKHRAAVMWDFYIEMPPNNVAAFEDKYRLNNLVLRLQVFKSEKTHSGGEPRPLLRQNFSFDDRD